MTATITPPQQAEFIFNLAQASLKTVTLDWETRDGTAVEGIDYVPAKGRLVFEPGEVSKTVLVSLLQPLTESRKFFTVAITNAVNATIDDSVPGQVVILPNAAFRGPRGYRGGRGQRGMTAYEEAVANGSFTGTYSDWLNFLKANGLAIEIGDRSNPSKGASLVGYRGRTVADELDTVKADLNALPGKVEPLGTAETKVGSHNHDEAAHPELRSYISGQADRAEAAKNAAQANATVYRSFATKAAMDADLGATAGQSAIVTDGIGKGWYTKVGAAGTGSWTRMVSQPVAEDDRRLPSERFSTENLAFSVVDADGKRTWLEVNLKDGGPSAWAELLMRRLFGVWNETRTGYLFAITDADRRMTDLAVRESDGQIPDWVMARWAGRIGKLLGTGTNAGAIFKNDTYVRNGEVLPVLPKMNSFTSWGTSTLDEWVELAGLAASFGASYYNGANGATLMAQGLAQMGVTPAMVAPVGGSIPASGTVNITCQNVPALAAFKPTAGTISGVAGVLKVTGSQWQFTRDVAGSAVAVPSAVEFVPTQGLAHRADFTLLNLGKNDVNDGTPLDTIYANHTKAFDWLSPFVKRVVVLNHFGHSGNSYDDPHTVRIRALNAYIAKRYGGQVFDLVGYLGSPAVWADTGFTPTSQDLTDQANGCLPATLSRDGIAHMNPTTRAAAAAKLKSFIQSLGWF